MAANVNHLTFNLQQNQIDLEFSVILNGYEKPSLIGDLDKRKFIELFDEIISENLDADYLKIKTKKLMSSFERCLFFIDQKAKNEIKDHSCVEYLKKPFFGKSYLTWKFDTPDSNIPPETTNVFNVSELFQEIIVTEHKKCSLQVDEKSALLNEVTSMKPVYCRLGLKVVIPYYSERSRNDLLNIRDSIIQVCTRWQSRLDHETFRSLKKCSISTTEFFEMACDQSFKA